MLAKCTGCCENGRLTSVEEEDLKACVDNDDYKLVGVAESGLVRAERIMYTVQARCITQTVPQRSVRDSAVERFRGSFLRMGPLSGALDKDAANGGFSGFFLPPMASMGGLPIRRCSSHSL